MNTLLQELSSYNSKISLRRLMDGNAVVEQVEAEYKPTVDILRVGVQEFRGESQDLAILCHELVEIFLGHLRYQGQNRSIRVLQRAKTVVRRSRRLWDGSHRQPYVQLIHQLLAELLFKKRPCKLISIIDEEIMGQDSNVLPHVEVPHGQEIVVGGSRICWPTNVGLPIFRQLPSAKPHWKIISAAIQGVQFTNLHGVVGQEIEQDERAPLILRSHDVVADSKETAHLPIILQELLHILVDVPTAKLDLAEELLVRALLDCSLPQSVLALGHCKHIRRHANRRWLLHTLAGAPFPCESVAVTDLKCLAIHLYCASNLDVTRTDIPRPVGLGHPVSSHKGPLRNTTVVNPRLCNVHRVIFQVVVHDAPAYSEILQIRLHDRLLEKRIEA
mmetsp:Transcript_23621/g.57357  ORF Transcript_23621/g.57357 Transcript_23621/m.57357 type:complete len:388 (-) Transcript_23621:195-1358(-)